MMTHTRDSISDLALHASEEIVGTFWENLQNRAISEMELNGLPLNWVEVV